MSDWKSDPLHPLHLDCVEMREPGERFDFWAVTPTGDYEADIRIGRAIAFEVVEFIRSGGMPILQHIADAQAVKGQSGHFLKPIDDQPEPTGTVVGFWEEIAHRLRST